MMFSMPTTTRSFKESRRELFAVDVLGLSLSIGDLRELDTFA